MPSLWRALASYISKHDTHDSMGCNMSGIFQIFVSSYSGWWMVTHVKVTLIKVINWTDQLLERENRTVRPRSSLEHFKTIISNFFSGINPPNQGNSRGTRRDWLVSYPRHVFWSFLLVFFTHSSPKSRGQQVISPLVTSTSRFPSKSTAAYFIYCQSRHEKEAQW